MSLVDKKVMSIGTVSKISGLTVRQIRYYEERRLIFPERTEGGTRLYSFEDVEKLVEIASQVEEGFQTHDIHLMENKRHKQTAAGLRKHAVHAGLFRIKGGAQ